MRKIILILIALVIFYPACRDIDFYYMNPNYSIRVFKTKSDYYSNVPADIDRKTGIIQILISPEDAISITKDSVGYRDYNIPEKLIEGYLVAKCYTFTKSTIYLNLTYAFSGNQNLEDLYKLLFGE